MPNGDGLLEGVPLVGVEHRLAKTKLEKDADKKFINEQSFFNNVDDQKTKEVVKPYAKVVRPKVVMLPMDKNDWAKNFVARFHNAIRKEVFDMYTMMECFYADAKKVRTFHVGLFFEWWDHFSSFLFAEFEVEQELIYKELSKRGAKLPDVLSADNLRQYASEIQAMVDSISSSRTGAENRPPIEPLSKCLKAMEALPIVIEFLDRVDRHLPRLLGKLLTEREGVVLEQDMLTGLTRTGDQRQYHAWIVINKLPDQKEVPAYKKKYCTAAVRMKLTNYAARFRGRHVRALREIVAHLGQEIKPTSPSMMKSPLVSAVSDTTARLVPKTNN